MTVAQAEVQRSFCRAWSASPAAETAYLHLQAPSQSNGHHLVTHPEGVVKVSLGNIVRAWFSLMVEGMRRIILGKDDALRERDAPPTIAMRSAMYHKSIQLCIDPHRRSLAGGGA